MTKLHTYQTNIDKKLTRKEMVDGIDYTVFPVVMMVEGAYYNGGLVTVDQMQPEAWNGRPVTNGHPEDDGVNVSANSKDMIEKFKIGMLLNARIDGNKFKADAYVDMRKVGKDLKQQLESNNSKLDVSTGYFCKPIDEQGEFNGLSYNEIHTELKPDHLAFLPNEEGACSWSDGAGVRANSKKGLKMTIKQALSVVTGALNINEDKEIENMKFEEIITKTGRCDAFTEDDRRMLKGMSEAAQSAIFDAIEKIDYNEAGDDKKEMACTEPDMNGRGEDQKPMSNASQLSKADLEALQFAREIQANHKREYISTITSNSKIAKQTLDKLSVNELKDLSEQIACNGLTTDRAAMLAAPEVADSSAEMAEYFSSNSLDDALKSKGK